MLRKPALLLFFLLTAASAAAQQNACNLTITVTCDATSCTSTTVNAGTVACNGDYFTGFFAGLPPSQVSFSNLTNTLGLGDSCFDDSLLGGTASEAFAFCFGPASLAPGASFHAHANVTSKAGAPASIPIIATTGVLDDISEEELAFVYAFNNVVAPTCTPAANVPPVTQSGVPYRVTWTTVSSGAPAYQIDESASADFATILSTQTVSATSAQFTHSVTNSTAYFYRVRSTSCGGSAGPYSPAVKIVVQAAPPPVTVSNGSRGIDSILPFGSEEPYSFLLFIPPPPGKIAGNDTVPYSVNVDKTYIKATPPSGSVGAGGSTVTVTVDPKGLPPGSSSGTVNVTNTNNGQSIGNVPVSISLVTPIAPGSKSLPPGNALIIPVVTHVNGATGPFQSDVRITNAAAVAISYQVTYTPTRTDATQSSKTTLITVDAGQTVALNDIAKDFFGIGATADPSDAGAGSLEIRPLNTSSTLTYASSRTFVTTTEGTLGQFIPATAFAKFATNSAVIPGTGGSLGLPAVLSLQQIAQSTKFRTNLGIVEGSGVPASGSIRIYDDLGTLLKSVPYSLLAGEHQQLNAFLATQGITLDDGRIEITVDSPAGAVSAYASVLDNITTDPLAVSPVQIAQLEATRWVLPGMADLGGGNNFHSDIRLYNGGSSVTVTPVYYPQGGGAPVSGAPITIPGGQVKAIDNVLPTLFNVTGTGGSIVFTSTAAARLVATGRTYTIRADNGGTFGQFIPGVGPAEGVGVGDKPLQILQLEQSQNFRTNLGLAELTGNPAHVRISLLLPDSKVVPFAEYDLAPFEFRQIGRVMEGLNPGKATYNGRIAVSVTDGSGRVTAYGSVIDNATSDPTYVPAQ
jgi:hypothetical protein